MTESEKKLEEKLETLEQQVGNLQNSHKDLLEMHISLLNRFRELVHAVVEEVSEE